MGKKAQQALRKAALGGSIGPAPKSHKITGEFRDPGERPHGQPWLRPWYASPRKIEEAIGTRREDDGPPIIPRVHSIAGRADGGKVDRLDRALLAAMRGLESVGAVDTPLRLFNDVVQRGRREPITERDFEPDEINALREIVHRKGGTSGTIDYPDYGDSDAAPKNALGGFKYEVDPQGGIDIADRYDFNTDRASPYEDNLAFRLARMLLVPRDAAASIGRRTVPPGTGPDVRLRIPGEHADGGSVSEFDDLDPIEREKIRLAGIGTVGGRRLMSDERAKILRDNFETVLGMLPGTGNAMSAADAYTSGGEMFKEGRKGNIKRALLRAAETGLNTVGAVTGIPGLKLTGPAVKDAARTANIFAGPTAKTADHAMLQRAEEMKAAGADRTDIWRETGWFQGAEGKWRFEIPDNRATIDASKATARDPMVPRVREARFDEIMDHPEMFRAYPDLGEANVMHMPSVGRGGPRASYVGGPGDDEFLHFYGDGDRLTSSGLHEAQHAVQAREGFTVGGNMNAAFAGSKADPRAFPLYQERVKMMTTPISIEEYVRQAGFDNVDEAREGYATYLKGVEKMRKKGLPSDLDRMVQEDVARTWYNRLAGEVEARNVQSRQHMTPEERRAAPPWETQDIADDQQILRQRQPGDRQDVFVPVTDERILKAAQDARREGASNETIFKKFERSFFSPEGKLKRQIDDSRMTVTSPERFEHGDSVRTGDFVDHPELFAAQPHLADTKLTFMPDNTMDRRGVARTNPQSGNFELSLGTHDPKWYRRMMAKLMQYRIGEDNRFSGAMRHGARNVLRSMDNAYGDAKMLLGRGQGDPWAAGAYMRHLEEPRAALREGLETGRTLGLERKIGDVSAGNVEAALVRNRVDSPQMGVMPYQPKRPGPNMPMGTPPFSEMITMPPSNATLPEMEQFLRDWHTYGAGRDQKFANGGRAKRVGRALRRAASVTVGAVAGSTPGRADALKVRVPAGSYVVPADVVAALGEGNSAAGLDKLGKQFPAKRANGGAVPIQISDGEFVIGPDAIAALGGGDQAYGHDILDAFVLKTRRDHINHLNSLPGPNQ